MFDGYPPRLVLRQHLRPHRLRFGRPTAHLTRLPAAIASKLSLARGRGILIEPRDALDEVPHPSGRPRPAPRGCGDIAGGERGGQGSRRRDTARPQFRQDRRQAGGARVGAVGLALVAFVGAGLDHLASI